MAGRFFSHGNIIQVEIGIAVAIVGSAFKHNDYVLCTHIVSEVDYLFRPTALVGETHGESRGVGAATICGDIYIEAAAGGVLPPKGQLHHPSSGEVQDGSLQIVGIAIAVTIRVESYAF